MKGGAPVVLVVVIMLLLLWYWPAHAAAQAKAPEDKVCKEATIDADVYSPTFGEVLDQVSTCGG